MGYMKANKKKHDYPQAFTIDDIYKWLLYLLLKY